MSDAAQTAAAHHASLFRWAMALGGRDRDEAMEIVQQTYLEVIEGRARLEEAADPRRYLFGVARRVAASRRRRRSLWGRILRLELTAAAPPTIGPEESASLEERARLLNAALRELPPRQLQVVTLVFVEGLTVEEAAGMMGVSVGSARTHYHRAKERLARLMDEDG